MQESRPAFVLNLDTSQELLRAGELPSSSAASSSPYSPLNPPLSASLHNRRRSLALPLTANTPWSSSHFQLDSPTTATASSPFLWSNIPAITITPKNNNNSSFTNSACVSHSTNSSYSFDLFRRRPSFQFDAQTIHGRAADRPKMSLEEFDKIVAKLNTGNSTVKTTTVVAAAASAAAASAAASSSSLSSKLPLVPESETVPTPAVSSLELLTADCSDSKMMEDTIATTDSTSVPGPLPADQPIIEINLVDKDSNNMFPPTSTVETSSLPILETLNKAVTNTTSTPGDIIIAGNNHPQPACSTAVSSFLHLNNQLPLVPQPQQQCTPSPSYIPDRMQPHHHHHQQQHQHMLPPNPSPLPAYLFPPASFEARRGSLASSVYSDMSDTNSIDDAYSVSSSSSSTAAAIYQQYFQQQQQLNHRQSNSSSLSSSSLSSATTTPVDNNSPQQHSEFYQHVRRLSIATMQQQQQQQNEVYEFQRRLSAYNVASAGLEDFQRRLSISYDQHQQLQGHTPPTASPLANAAAAPEPPTTTSYSTMNILSYQHQPPIQPTSSSLSSSMQHMMMGGDVAGHGAAGGDCLFEYNNNSAANAAMVSAARRSSFSAAGGSGAVVTSISNEASSLCHSQLPPPPPPHLTPPTSPLATSAMSHHISPILPSHHYHHHLHPSHGHHLHQEQPHHHHPSTASSSSSARVVVPGNKHRRSISAGSSSLSQSVVVASDLVDMKDPGSNNNNNKLSSTTSASIVTPGKRKKSDSVFAFSSSSSENITSSSGFRRSTRPRVQRTNTEESDDSNAEVEEEGNMTHMKNTMSRDSSMIIAPSMNAEDGTRVFSCPVCHRGFARKYNMVQHSKIHENVRVKQHSCPQCNQSFYRAADMNRHMKTHLVNDVFVSPCGKQFSRFDAIDRHRKRTGCERCQADFDKMNRSLGGEGPGSIPLKH